MSREIIESPCLSGSLGILTGSWVLYREGLDVFAAHAANTPDTPGGTLRGGGWSP
jgi:hypothetical protein